MTQNSYIDFADTIETIARGDYPVGKWGMISGILRDASVMIRVLSNENESLKRTTVQNIGSVSEQN